MPRQPITTASLLRDISERREAAASNRWRQMRRDYMRLDRPATPIRDRSDETDTGGSRPASV